MKTNMAKITRIFSVALVLVLSLAVVLLTACGGKKVEAGEYSATITKELCADVYPVHHILQCLCKGRYI